MSCLLLSASILIVTTTITGAAAVWLARTAARRYGFVDKPDGHRKLQSNAVAVSGGLGVLLGAVGGLVLVGLFVPEAASALTDRPEQTWSLLAAAVVIALVGLVDDLVSLRARHKLIGQIAAALILAGPGGYLIENISLFGNSIALGQAALPITLFWFLAAVNAINLLDGMDGLLGTIGIIIFGGVAAMAFSVGQLFVGFVALGMVGSLIGFLIFNLPPATVYLGDCGSMLIGLVIAALTITASLKGPAVAILAPAALLVLPILDTTAAIVRRKLTGRGLAIADRGHFHHELQRRGMNRWRVLGIAGGIGLIGTSGALVGILAQNDMFAVASAAVVVLLLLLTGWFGLAELRLLTARAYAVLDGARGRKDSVETAVHVQGRAEWRNLWRKLIDASNAMGVQSLRLDVNAPAWHESFHGRWDRSDSQIGAMPQNFWKLELPVVCREIVVGKMTVVGLPDGLPMGEQMASLWTILLEVETILPTLKRPTLSIATCGPEMPISPEPAALPASA